MCVGGTVGEVDVAVDQVVLGDTELFKDFYRIVFLLLYLLLKVGH